MRLSVEDVEDKSLLNFFSPLNLQQVIQYQSSISVDWRLEFFLYQTNIVSGSGSSQK
jgi:hypothetical protein